MSIPGAGNPLLLGGAGGYKIERSLRFNSADSASLTKTFASAGNKKKWTLSFWVKRTAVDTNFYTILESSPSTNKTRIGFYLNNLYIDNTWVTSFTWQSIAVFRDASAWCHITVALDTAQATASDRLKVYFNGVALSPTGGSSYPAQNQEPLINDIYGHAIGGISGTYASLYLADIHFIDGQALTPSSFGETDANGIWQPKAYSGSYGTNGFHLDFANNSTAAALGTDTSGNGNTWTVNNISVAAGNGNYISSTTGTTSPAGTSFGNMFDGDTGTFVRAAPSSTVTFTKTFTGVTTLRVYASRLGGNLRVNGTVVPNGSNGTWWNIDLTSIGSTITDISFTSGTNPNLFEVYAIEVNGTVLVDNSFGAGNDSLVDSPTSYGTDTGAGGEVRGNYATLNPLNQGASITLSNGNLDFSYSAAGGVVTTTFPISAGKWYWEFSNFVGYVLIGCYQSGPLSMAYLGNSGVSFGFTNSGFIGSNGVTAPTGTITFGGGDVVGFAFNRDAGTLNVYKNGILSLAYTGLSGDWYPAVGQNAAGSGSFNFGQRQWAYAPPAGFKALCTQNLPAPTITKPSTVMDVALWTGTSANQTVSGLNFNPDLIWIKIRSDAKNHAIQDSVRGFTTLSKLSSSGNFAEGDTSNMPDWAGYVNGATSTGFTLTKNGTGADDWVHTNKTGNTYVGWCWDAGSSTVTNTDGTISSQVRANASAGFSIVTAGYFSGTVGHGLGVAPAMVIVKTRNVANNWYVYHKDSAASGTVANNSYLIMNSTGAVTNAGSNIWNVTSTTVSSNQGLTDTGVYYCFAPVAGYSAFGSYTGNGSADGPFVYTGFRPRYVMVKSSSTGGTGYDWIIKDTERDTINTVTNFLIANGAQQENYRSDSTLITDLYFDFLSNGFKVRTNRAAVNGSTVTFIYAAFAEAPFALARAR